MPDPPRGPLSWHDLARSFDEHRVEDQRNFDGMKRSFEDVEKVQRELNEKQDTQLDVLNELLNQAKESALERGRRVEREAGEARAKKRRDEIFKWMRWILIPIALGLTHYFTKASTESRVREEVKPTSSTRN